MILPKPFRRLVDYLHLGDNSMAGFPAFLDQAADKFFILSTGHSTTGLDAIVEVTGNNVKMTRPIEDLVFDEKWWYGSPQRFRHRGLGGELTEGNSSLTRLLRYRAISAVAAVLGKSLHSVRRDCDSLAHWNIGADTVNRIVSPAVLPDSHAPGCRRFRSEIGRRRWSNNAMPARLGGVQVTATRPDDAVFARGGRRLRSAVAQYQAP